MFGFVRMIKKTIDFFKKYGTWIILAVNICVLAVIIITDEDFSKGFIALEKLSPFMMVMCFAVFALTFVFEGLQFYYITRMFGTKFPLGASIHAIIVERYYSAITPTCIGGQPALMFYLMHRGVPGPEAASAMSLRFILYQFTLVAGLLALFVLMPIIGISINAVMMTALIVGTLVAAAVPLVILLFAIFPKISYKGIRLISDLAYKLRITKDADKLYDKVTDTVMMYSRSMKRLKFRYTVVVIFFAIAQFATIMSMPYLASYACSVEIPYIESFGYTLILNTAVAYMPTPGASGAAEGAFFTLFKDMIPAASIMIVMLLWRLASYYFVIISGMIESGIMAISSAFKKHKKTA